MIMCSVLSSYCVCRRPSWKPKTQPNGSSAVVWLSFWFSTRFTRKILDHSRGTYLYLVVPYRHLTLFWKILFAEFVSSYTGFKPVYSENSKLALPWLKGSSWNCSYRRSRPGSKIKPGCARRCQLCDQFKDSSSQRRWNSWRAVLGMVQIFYPLTTG